jgi:hypothetical protein
MLRTCHKCKLSKCLEVDFYKDKSNKSGYSYRCKICDNTKVRKRQCRTGRRINKNNTRDRFPEAYAIFMKLQNGRCAICDSSQDVVLDHCHKENRPRGILCRQCNAALGIFRDDIKIVRRAVEYLSSTASPRLLQHSRPCNAETCI